MPTQNEDSDAQAEELLVCEAIFCDDNLNVYTMTDYAGSIIRAGHLEIPCSFSDSLLLTTGQFSNDKMMLNNLPPIVFRFELPLDYPSNRSPRCDIEAPWLDFNKCNRLYERLSSVWSENRNTEILYSFVECIKDEIASMFNQNSILNVNSVITCCSPCPPSTSSSRSQHGCDDNMIKPGGHSDGFSNPSIVRARNILGCQTSTRKPHFTCSQLYRVLLEFDLDARRKTFELEYFECDVCADRQIGRLCIRFEPCLHVFCQQCCFRYFELQIVEGGARSGLKCLAESCNSECPPFQVKTIVESDKLYSRYEQLMLMNALEIMSDIVPCARPACQMPVLLDENKDEKLARCSVCEFSFCKFCRKTYHGIDHCVTSSLDRDVIMKKMESGDRKTKDELLARLGQKQLQNIIDEALAHRWVKDNAKKCPSCGVNIEKTDGCNKMRCMKCGANFCWLCERLTNQINPYSHFNNPQTKCYNLLFQGTWDENFDDDD